MKSAPRPRKITHAPPNAASLRGLSAARAALEGERTPWLADAQSQSLHALAQAPYRKGQGELALQLPEPDPS